MPRIEEVREPGYYFVIPKKQIPSHPVVEVKPDNNTEKFIPDKEPPHPMVFKEEQKFSYDLPQAKLLPPSLTELDRTIKYVELNRNNEVVEHKTPQVAPNQNREQLLDRGIKQVFPDQNIESNLSTDIKMVKPMTTEGRGEKGVEMVKPMFKEETGTHDIVPVKPMTLEGVGSTDIKMVKPMSKEGAGSKGVAMVYPMTKEDAGSHGLVPVLPMFKEELVPSNRPGVTWSKGVVLSKYPMVQGADLMDSLKEHFFDTIERMTTGFAEDLKDWMKQKRESLKKEFHDFVSTTMRDYENSIMNPLQTLAKNSIQNPIGTISEFPKNIKTAFGDIKQGVINTTVDAGVAVGNKAIDTANAGIAMGNTGIEVLNKVDAFFGGKGNTLPIMKTIPRLPSREELLNQAVMKGGSMAKMNPAGDFDTQAFKDAAEAGKIDREALINMGSTPVFNNSLPDDYSQWSGTPLWFTLQDDNVTIDEKNPPVILDNTGRETSDEIGKEGRKLGEKSYNYMGYREGEFKSVMEGIYRGNLGFQAQPDIYCDINITPHKFKNTGIMEVYFYPPKYPKDILGDFMVADFQAQSIIMNTEEQWNLGVYGSIPLVVNYILPSNLSIRFVADANLKTAKWLTAYQEYMSGYQLNPHVMRPYKMCCQEITLYALTFYGEVVHAKTFLAYPLLKDDYSLLGSGGAKHFDVDWVVVGLKEFRCKPSTKQLDYLKPDTTNTAYDVPDTDIPAIASDGGVTPEEAVIETKTTAISAVLSSNTANIQGGQYTDSDVTTVNNHTEKFLDTVKNSQSVGNKLKALAESDGVKALAERTGLSKVLGDISKLADIDILIKGGCNYLVCAYTNHIASPSYGLTKVPYNSTNMAATYNGKSVLGLRFNECDNLAIKRAAEYVNSLLKKGVARENIKVILASCDGIPGMDAFISGTAMTGGFYLGGIYQYTKAECEMDSGDGNTPGLAQNRRVDLIYFDDFVADCPEAIDGMMGKGSSDARGNEDKLKLLWNRIPKVSYGRDPFWGNAANRYPNFNKDIDLGINGFSNIGSTSSGKQSTQETNEERYDSIMKGAEENDLKVDSGLGDTADIQKAADTYKKAEEVKQTTEEKTITYGVDYKIRYTIKYVNFYESCQDANWFNDKFGKNFRKYFFDDATPRVPSFYNGGYGSLDEYFSRTSSLPQAKSEASLYPVLVVSQSFSLFEQDIKDMFIIKYYFSDRNYGWIYSQRDDELRFYQKINL